MKPRTTNMIAHDIFNASMIANAPRRTLIEGAFVKAVTPMMAVVRDVEALRKPA